MISSSLGGGKPPSLQTCLIGPQGANHPAFSATPHAGDLRPPATPPGIALRHRRGFGLQTAPARRPDLPFRGAPHRGSTAADSPESLGFSPALIDLQWFAAEDEGRTEEPTDITYQKAREEGRVAKSQELSGALVLLAPAIVIFFLAPGMLKTCVEMLRFFFLRATELDPVKDKIIVGVFFSYLVRLALPIAVVAMVAGFFANLVQTGLLFTTKPLNPDFNRILPHFGRYFQRTLFSMEGLFNFAKSIVKMAIIGLVAFFLIRSRFKELANLQTAGLWQGITVVASLAARMLIISALLMLLLSIPDYMFQRWQFRESLKMSREAAKEERKQTEGDPQIRARLRSKYRELITQDMMRNVPKADVVVTNPTHYAVALEYNLSDEAPKITAKGEDDLALRIRRIAEDNGVPVKEHPPLARALYAETEVGDIIPPKYWQVVITILGNVWNLDKKRREAQEARRERERA